MAKGRKDQALRWLERIKGRDSVGRRVKAIDRVEEREKSTAQGWVERRAVVFEDGSEVVVDYGDDGFTMLDWWGEPVLWNPSRTGALVREHEFATFERAELPEWLR